MPPRNDDSGAGFRPWYRDAAPEEARDPHVGLIFDKFCNAWNDETGTITLDGKLKTPFLENYIIQSYRNSTTIPEAITAALSSRQKLVTALGGEVRTFATTWRVVTGLGGNHVLENSFVWHPTLSVPSLPGSSIKGMMRAWADPAKGWSDDSRWVEHERLFGGRDLGAGALIVFDALPVRRVEIDVDIMNVHHKRYYSDPTSNPPADYENPDLIHFLAIEPGAEFVFALAPRPTRARVANDAEVEAGFTLLQEALEVIGIGAKTAAGYGRFAPVRR